MRIAAIGATGAALVVAVAAAAVARPPARREPPPAPVETSSVTAAARPASAAAPALASGLPALAVPVEGVRPEALRDTYDDGRPGHRHEAIDIAAARGTPVVAAVDGTVVKLLSSVPGGLTVYQFDVERRHAYYYAHLDRYADGLREGQPLRRGERLGYVGTTGNAAPDAPHLHFAVFRLGAEKQWWKGEPVNPFAALTSR